MQKWLAAFLCFSPSNPGAEGFVLWVLARMLCPATPVHMPENTLLGFGMPSRWRLLIPEVGISPALGGHKMRWGVGKI